MTDIDFNSEQPRKKRPLLLRIILIPAVLLLVYIAAMLTIEIPQVQSLTYRVREFTYDLLHEENYGDGDLNNEVSLEDMDDTVPFHVEIPQWLPDGVVFISADYDVYHTGIYNVYLEYGNESDDKHITFIETNDSAFFDTVYSMRDCVVEEYSIKNNDVVIITFIKSRSCIAFYMNDRKTVIHINVGNTLNKEALIKIIENMK